MIYKIIMDFKDLQKLIEKLSEYFYVLFSNNSLYICSKNLKNISVKKIRDIIQEDNVFLLCIDQTNIKNETDRVRDWCESYYIERDIKNFEKNEQELLKQYMNVLDNCEEELKKYMMKGGCLDG